MSPIMEDIFIVYNLEIRFVFILSDAIETFSSQIYDFQGVSGGPLL